MTQALGHNLELAAARLGIAEAQGRLQQAGRMANPELESEIKPNVRGREYSLGAGFMQKFPLTNRLRLEKAISRAELAAAEAEVKIAERKLAGNVRTLGVKILSLQASRELKEQQRQTSQQLVTAATKAAALAEGSGLEAAQLELEAQQLSLELLKIEGEQTALHAELRPLLGLATRDAVEITGNLSGLAMPANAVPEVGSRAEMQMAQAKIAAAHHGIALAKASRWQDLGVGLGVAVDRQEDAPDGLQTDGIIGVKFSLPLPLWNSQEGKIHEAEATAARSEKAAEALQAQVLAEAATAYAEMAAARRIVDQISNVLLPKAREIEQKFTNFYEHAQPGTQLVEVLRSRDKRLALEQTRLEALSAFHLAGIRLQAALGH